MRSFRSHDDVVTLLDFSLLPMQNTNSAKKGKHSNEVSDSTMHDFAMPAYAIPPVCRADQAGTYNSAMQHYHTLYS